MRGMRPEAPALSVSMSVEFGSVQVFVARRNDSSASRRLVHFGMRRNRFGGRVYQSAFMDLPQVTFQPERFDLCLAAFVAFFSGGHTRSPVSTSPRGEWNTITNRWFGESALTQWSGCNLRRKQ
jgi:hypothetical protein